MTRISAVSLAIAALLLTATSCTTEESPSTTAADGCEEALGDSGVKWVESHADLADGDDLDRGGVDLEEARAQHYKQMEDGGSDEYQYHWSSEICKMIAFDAGESKELRLEFGPLLSPSISRRKKLRKEPLRQSIQTLNSIRWMTTRESSSMASTSNARSPARHRGRRWRTPWQVS